MLRSNPGEGVRTYRLGPTPLTPTLSPAGRGSSPRALRRFGMSASSGWCAGNTFRGKIGENFTLLPPRY